MGAETVGGLQPHGHTHARAVTRGPKFHWFGYYDKCPWSADGRLMLAMEVDFMDRSATAEDSIRVGVIDLETVMAVHTWTVNGLVAGRHAQLATDPTGHHLINWRGAYDHSRCTQAKRAPSAADLRRRPDGTIGGEPNSAPAPPPVMACAPP